MRSRQLIELVRVLQGKNLIYFFGGGEQMRKDVSIDLS
jgi:hypothetical protein